VERVPVVFLAVERAPVVFFDAVRAPVVLRAVERVPVLLPAVERAPVVFLAAERLAVVFRAGLLRAVVLRVVERVPVLLPAVERAPVVFRAVERVPVFFLAVERPLAVLRAPVLLLVAAREPVLLRAEADRFDEPVFREVPPAAVRERDDPDLLVEPVALDRAGARREDEALCVRVVRLVPVDREFCVGMVDLLIIRGGRVPACVREQARSARGPGSAPAPRDPSCRAPRHCRVVRITRGRWGRSAAHAPRMSF